MNVMSFAHFMTKRQMERRIGNNRPYKQLFSWTLSDAHRLMKRYGVEALVKAVTEYKAIDKRIANEKMIVRKVVKNALSLGYTISLFDGEEWPVKRSTSASEVMAAIMSTDEDTLSFRKDGEHAGSVLLVYGNSASEVIADYSDTATMATILAPANARADKLAAVGL